MTVAVQAGLVVRLLCAYCRLSKFVLSIYYEKQRLPLAESLGLRHMTYSKSTSLFELPQKLRPQDADRFEKRRPFLKNCVLSPKNGVSANADNLKDYPKSHMLYWMVWTKTLNVCDNSLCCIII